MAKQNIPPDFAKHLKEIHRARPRMVAIEAKNFFKDGFRKGGFTDKSFEAWPQRDSPLGGKKILIGKGNTENLMQSIRTFERNKNRVRTGTDVVYADIHNKGGKITVTPAMKKFWWAKYYEFAGKIKTTKTGKMSQAKANLVINKKAEFCRNMALMKVGSKIKIPQRRFIGESQTLLKQFEEWFAAEIDKLKSSLNYI